MNGSPPGVPEATDRVFVASGQVVIMSDVTVTALHLAGGTLLVTNPAGKKREGP